MLLNNLNKMNNPMYRKKNLREPLIKIGSKQETLAYSSKNTDPSLNLLNRQIYEESTLAKSKQKTQKEEFAYLSRCYEASNAGRPNLAHQKIDFDNITGKIGQENKLEEIIKYQNNKGKSNLFGGTGVKKDIRSINYHGYNIINNNILGFCDPNQKFPETSYQKMGEDRSLSEEIGRLTKQQYEDYLSFRKQQLEQMSRGGLGKNLRVLPGKGIIEGVMDPQKEDEMRRKMWERELEERDRKKGREREYMEEVQRMAREEREMNRKQVGLTNKTYFQNEEIPPSTESRLPPSIPNSSPELPQQNINGPNSSSLSPAEEEYLRMQEENQRKSEIEAMEKEGKIEEELLKEFTPEQIAYFKERERREKEYEEGREREVKPKIPPKESQNRLSEKEYASYLEQLKENNLAIQNSTKKPQFSEEDLERMKYESYLKEVRDQNEINYDEMDKELMNKYSKQDEEYLKNVEKYEQIIRDDPEASFKLPHPPFMYPEQQKKIQKSRDSQIQGATPGNIGKDNYIQANPYTMKNYSLGDSNLASNPILHPINSYKFDYSKLYNSLASNANPKINGVQRLQNAGNSVITK